MKRKHEDRLIESHEEKSWRRVMKKSHEEKSWRKVMKKSHEEKSWRKVIIESHDEKTWRLFDRKSWRMNKLFITIYLSLCLDESNRKFKSILNFNTLTQLKYLIQTSWFNLNTRFQNSDSNQVLTSRELDSISMIQLDVISLVVEDIWNTCAVKKINDEVHDNASSYSSKSKQTI